MVREHPVAHTLAHAWKVMMLDNIDAYGEGG